MIVAAKRQDHNAALNEIKTLKLANQALRDAQPGNHIAGIELKSEGNRRLAYLLNKFEQVQNVQPKFKNLEK